MGELKDRRARKKAQTREPIRTVAHRMFAERGFDAVTIADIAREADVAVQTVFNHFATKEELFFDGRADWVDGAARRRPRPRRGRAAAERAARAPDWPRSPRTWTSLSDPAHRAMIATLEASPALSAYERELHHECRPPAERGARPRPSAARSARADRGRAPS